ncbi:hypothetical protein AZF07_07755 [Corynebacterium diphtheriae subsp. lausannense]|nr:hypothetical protein AZF07_07755 [Corynebacterium diphtheriae subsp. lausannense]
MVGGGSTMAARLGLSPLEVAAWTAIGDAGIISGSDIVKPQHNNLVSRMLRANAALATAGEASADFSDNATLIDVSCARIPHSRPTMRYRFFRAMSVYSHSVITATQVFCAAFIAITIGVALGFDRPDWAVVSVLLILQWGPSFPRHHRRYRYIYRPSRLGNPQLVPLARLVLLPIHGRNLGGTQLRLCRCFYHAARHAYGRCE